MDYLIIFFGSLLGMSLLIAGKSFYVQRSSKYQLNFWQAFKVYTTKYTGPIVVSFIITFIAMFIFPEILAAANSETETRYTKIINEVVGRLRIYSIGLGFAGQGIGFIIIRKGTKYIKDAEAKLFSDEEKPEEDSI